MSDVAPVDDDMAVKVGRSLFPGHDPESAAKMARFMLRTASMDTEIAHVLYRHFDSHGTLLYVGISQWRQRKTRQTTHACQARWWAFVERTEFEDYDDEKPAREAERTAIAQEKPIFNLDRNGTPGAQRKRELTYIRSRICQHEHLAVALPEGAPR